MPGPPTARRLGVIGLGGVGGVIAARTGALCVATPRTAAALRADGLLLRDATGTVVVHPEVTETLDEPVELLVVAVKSYALEAALERVRPEAVTEALVLPLLNGLEHVERLRELLAGTGATIAAGSIGRFQAHLEAPGRVVQESDGALVTVASDVLDREALERAVAPLRAPGIDVELGESEVVVLWDKAVRLAVLAPATAASGQPVGVLRADPVWRARLRAAFSEAAAAAAAAGVDVDVDAQWTFVESLAPGTTTSAARDAATGSPTELDAITGSVVRAARRAGVATPELDRLLAAALGAAAR